MVSLKTSRELRLMREAGKISQEALLKAGEAVKPGVSTYELDKIVRTTIEKAGAVPSFLGYGGFPASACISVNNVVIHGIPSKKQILREGDIVSIDAGALYEGLQHGRVCLRPSKWHSPAIVSAISALRCSGMLKLAITRWYAILSATA